jgi:hypothetical protein
MNAEELKKLRGLIVFGLVCVVLVAGYAYYSMNKYKDLE